MSLSEIKGEVRLPKSNLSLSFQKEEEITRLEARLRKRGVPMENIRRISVATKRSDTIPESTPRLKIRGDRYAPLNVSVNCTKLQRRNPVLIVVVVVVNLPHFLLFLFAGTNRTIDENP